MRFSSVAVFAFAIAGCAPVSQEETTSGKLHNFIGQSENEVVAKLGHPTSSGVKGGEQFDQWSVMTTTWIPATSAITAASGGFSMTDCCSIEVFYNGDNIVTHVAVIGNEGGCSYKTSKLLAH